LLPAISADSTASPAGKKRGFCQLLSSGGAVVVESNFPSALSHFDPTDLLDALSTGIVMLDAQLCAIYANVAAQDLLAFSLSKVREETLRQFHEDVAAFITETQTGK